MGSIYIEVYDVIKSRNLEQKCEKGVVHGACEAELSQISGRVS